MWLSLMGTLSVVKALEHMQDEGGEQWPLGYSNVLSGAMCSGWAPQFVRTMVHLVLWEQHLKVGCTKRHGRNWGKLDPFCVVCGRLLALYKEGNFYKSL